VPELPEVETVRAGLARQVLGRVVARADVLRDYSVRRQPGGPEEFVGRLVGRRLDAAVRRGKYLWLLLDVPAEGRPEAALMAHLGMSGQLLVPAPHKVRAAPAHLRVRLGLDDGTEVHYVDQRTFGHLSVTALVGTRDGAAGGLGSPAPVVPEPVAHIARDLLDPAVDRKALIANLRRRRTGVKRALLDQRLVSGIGNIYADEALWRARLHFARATDTLRRAEVERLLDAAAEVMAAALDAGGTTFDRLYLDVNGRSGAYGGLLAVYGKAGRPCPRCGTPVRREEFMNRSSFSCPRCQPRPRNGRW